jgi:hypothetical protein
MKFSKSRMIQRLTEEGRADQITDEILEIMDDLDGRDADASCWDRQVKGLPVYLVRGRSGALHYVNENDCD